MNAPLRLGLLGCNIASSQSPRLHGVGLAALGLVGQYQLFEASDVAAAQAVIARLRGGALSGLNVTTPYKALAAACADVVVDPSARHSANTLWMRKGQLFAGSSDGPGILLMLRAAGVKVAGARVGLVGAGGAAVAVAGALVGAGATLRWVLARNQTAARDLLQSLDSTAAIVRRAASGALALPWAAHAVPDVDLCIHATRLGHGAGEDGVFSPEHAAAFDALGEALWRLPACHVDLVVNRGAWTPWQRRALAHGVTASSSGGPGVLAQSGTAMLVAQAAISLGWWTGQSPPLRAMAAALSVPWLVGDGLGEA